MKNHQFFEVFAPEARNPRLQPTKQALTCHHQLPTTSLLGSKGWYQVVGSNFQAQNRPTNHQERATNQPKQQPTTDHQHHQPTNQTTADNQPTNNQATKNRQPTNRPTTDNQQPSNQPTNSKDPKTQELRTEAPMARRDVRST